MTSKPISSIRVRASEIFIYFTSVYNFRLTLLKTFKGLNGNKLVFKNKA